MLQNSTSCIKVSNNHSCPLCKSQSIIKNGTTKNKKQQYHCKNCNKRFIDFYTHKAHQPSTNNSIILLTKEGLGIRSTARILRISTTTLLKRIIAIAASIVQPAITKAKTYEVDEMRTFIRRKEKLTWIVYALERETKKVVSFNVGPRTNKTLNFVLKSLKLSQAKRIFTDGLKNYKYLIESTVHNLKRFSNNHIERKNLTVRTHLKRLNRRTICFSKSSTILTAILRIYF